MNESDITKLLGDRIAIQNTVSSLASSGLEEEVQRKLDTVSIFCGKSETWEFFVSAAGYLDYVGEEDALTVNQIIEKIEEDTVRATNYFDSVFHLPVATVLFDGRKTAQQTSKDQKFKIIPLVSVLSYCESRCGDNPQCLEDCLTAFRDKQEREPWRNEITQD